MKLILTCLASLLLVFTISAQVTLRGTVTDQNNAGVAGAIVQVEGTNNSTTTDINGNFSIQLTDGYETLVINGEGLQTQKIYLTGQTSISIKMKSGGSNGNMVNMGIGSQSKDKLTSSVSSVSAEDVSPAPLINLEQANQGVTAGLFVQNSSGKLGQGTTVRIRGGSSLSASNQPLYVVDGVPLTSGNQSNINPSNIASIEILKDAAATAIYGTRAANGVIIITTKSGNTGGMQVNVDYQFAVSQTPKKLDIQSADENRLQTFEGIVRGYDFAVSGLPGVLDPEIVIDDTTTPITTTPITYDYLRSAYNSNISSVVFYDQASDRTFTFNIPGFYDDLTYNTDWQEEIFRSAPSHRANVDVQGGTEQLGYFASVGYTTQEGILIGNKFDRLNGSVSLDSKLSDKLSANLNINYIHTKDDRLNEDQDLGAPLQAIVLPPSDSYDPANNYRLLVRSLEYNPLTEIHFADNQATNSSIIGSLGLKYDFSEKFSIDVNGGVDKGNVQVERRQGPETLDGAPTGRSQLSEQITNNYVLNGWATYNPEMNGSNKLSVILGGSYQKSTTTYDFRQANVNSIATLEALAETDPSLFNEPIQGDANVFLSSYARVSYSINKLYDFQVTARMDGSSKFSEDNRFGYFPAVSAGWNMHNADFFSSNSVSQLRLRASYGLVGNAPTDDFLYRRNYIRTRYNDEDAVELANLSNEKLKWETTSQLNVGVDFGFMSNRISGSVDYYIKTTTDLLFPIPVSQTSGFATIFDNIGTMENKGFEINLSSVNVSTPDFSWTTDFNISSNKNTITDLNGEQAIVGVNAFLEGESAGVFYMRNYVGVDPATGNALYDDGNGGTTDNWEEAPRQIMGDPNPDFFGGLTNAVTYKNWTLSAMFQFVGGADLYFATGEYLANSGILNLGQLSRESNRWYEPGDEALYPGLNPFQDEPNPSSRWLEDGSYVRLKNITITYNFPADKLSGMGLRNLSVYVGATNLLTFTDYVGYDPDVSYFDPLDGIIGQNISRGIDNFTAPQPRIFMSGIKIGF
ncbi:SusC/RagA family TonB-linked outer membrane protein [Ekhidna sp.]|uniref:SusC/RagA family TonB-linked outer membrane protein n=1 Tax=Ekhidna sp. TaxID=2608089 RepID=UPI003513608A